MAIEVEAGDSIFEFPDGTSQEVMQDALRRHFGGQQAPAPTGNLKVALAGDIQRATDKYGLPPGLLERMIQTESSWNPEAVSPKGATGILQFMPATAQELKINPRDPKQSVEGAARYLARLNANYDGDWSKTLAAYNWGPGNLARLGMEKMPEETRNYLTKTLGDASVPAKMETPEPVRASQADVRKAEQGMAAPETPVGPGVGTLEQRVAKREALEAQAEAVRIKVQRIKQELGRLGMTTRGRVPAEARAAADAQIAELEAQREALLAEASKLAAGTTGRTLGGLAGGVLGGVGGAALGGWTGPGAIATGMAGSVAGTGLGSALGSAIDTRLATDITREEAIQRMKSGAVEDMAWDAAGNLILFGGGKVLKLAGVTPAWLAGLKKSKILEGADDVTKRAVAGIEQRAGGARVAPMQITDEPGFLDRASKALAPDVYERQARQVKGAVETMRDELLQPTDPRAAQKLGQTVVDTAEDYVRGVKAETAPVFRAAGEAVVTVDARPVQEYAAEVLARAKGTLGERGNLRPGDIAWLQSIVDGRAGLSAQGALDSISELKRLARAETAEGVPPEYLKVVLKDMEKLLDSQYNVAIAGLKREGATKNLADELLAARQKYRVMNETVYDDTIKQALRSEPENIGRMLWQSGQVSRIDDLKGLVDNALKQGTLKPLDAELLYRNVAQGFLEENLTSVERLAALSERLRDPKFRRTFEALADLSPATRSLLKDDMAVLSRAAKISMQNMPSTAPSTMFRMTTPVVAGVTAGTIASAGAAIPIMALLHALSVARTQQNKGVINQLHRLATLAPVGTPASQQAARELLIKLNPWLTANGITLTQEQ